LDFWQDIVHRQSVKLWKNLEDTINFAEVQRNLNLSAVPITPEICLTTNISTLKLSDV